MQRLSVALWLCATGCVGPWDPAWDTGASDDTELPEWVEVDGPIRADTRWSADTVWVLTEPVFVEAGARLTIEAGTTIVGEQGSMLVVTRDGTLDAQGTPLDPIVFTSDAPEGERVAGDWGGLVMLGQAPIAGAPRALSILGDEDSRSVYGGDDPDHNCGVLAYVRVEFAGLTRSRDEGLDGLTLAGCGEQTVVDRVQVHRTLRDGVQVFGGEVGLQHLLITAPGEDGLDWDQGWSGPGQFIVVQQQLDFHPEDVEAAIHGASNDGPDGGVLVSRPFLSNVTLIGPGSTEGTQVGLKLASGTAGQLMNVLSVGFGGELFDVCDPQTAAAAEGQRLGLRSLVAHDIGPDGQTLFRDESDGEDDDDGFDELALFEQDGAGNRLVTSTLMPSRSTAAADPEFVPFATVWVDATAAERPPEGAFWDESARFVGAVEPGSSPGEAWYAGWSDFPLN